MSSNIQLEIKIVIRRGFASLLTSAVRPMTTHTTSTSDLAGSSFADLMKRYVENLCSEDHLKHDEHQDNLIALESGWKDQYADNSNLPLCTKPSFYFNESSVSQWTRLSAAAPGEEIAAWRTSIDEEAKRYKDKFEEDVQFVFSRTQHHWHNEKNGERVPLQYCRKKGDKHRLAKKKTKHAPCEVCKQDFPKHKQINLIPKVICRGVARQHGLSIKGRRNALGLLLARRRCGWFSGTSAGFASVFKSNTHTVSNYRIPLMPETHDCTEDRLRM